MVSAYPVSYASALFPFYFIIVHRLHYTVTLAKGYSVTLLLPFEFSRWIEMCLQFIIEHLDTSRPLL